MICKFLELQNKFENFVNNISSPDGYAGPVLWQCLVWATDKMSAQVYILISDVPTQEPVA